MSLETNDLISYIRLQPENHDIINIFIYTQPKNKKHKRNNRYNLKKLDIKPYRRCIQESNCCICFENIKSNEYIRELNCNHTFHKKCIDKWLLYSMKSKEYISCPVCRSVINILL